MSEIKDEKQKDISTEYAMKFFHEDLKMSGFMYVENPTHQENNESLEKQRARNRTRTALKKRSKPLTQ